MFNREVFPALTSHRAQEDKGGGSIGRNDEKFGRVNWGSEKKVRTEGKIKTSV